MDGDIQSSGESFHANAPSPCPLPPGERVFRPPPSTGGGGGRVITDENYKQHSVKLAPIGAGGFFLSVSPASPAPHAKCPISLDLQKLGQGISIGGFRSHRSAPFHQRGG